MTITPSEIPRTHLASTAAIDQDRAAADGVALSYLAVSLRAQPAIDLRPEPAQHSVITDPRGIDVVICDVFTRPLPDSTLTHGDAATFVAGQWAHKRFLMHPASPHPTSFTKGFTFRICHPA